MSDTLGIAASIAFSHVLVMVFGVIIGASVDTVITQSELQAINDSCEVYTVEVDDSTIMVNCQDGTAKRIKSFGN